MRYVKRPGAAGATVVAAVLALSACGGEAPAQSVTSGSQGVDEGAPADLELTATFPEPFGLITNVRELDDGTLLVADPLSKVLVHIDMATGSSDTVGSEGPGPDEYRQPDAIYALTGGRSFLVDLGNARFTELAADHSFGQTYPLATGSPGPGGNFEVKLPEGVDLQGRVYYQGRVMSLGTDSPTTAPIRRWDPALDLTEDVVEVALPEREVQESGGANNRNVSIRQIPMAAEDQWAVGPDGRIAVARHTPFRLEWVGADGSVTTGPEVAYDPVSIGVDEQREWLARRSETGGGLSISVEMDNNRRRTTFQRGGSGGASRAEINEYTWPEAKPPFESVRVASDGTAWVRRSQPAGAPALYDIFDAQGRRTGSVALDGRRRIVTFTDESIYVVRLDEFDLQHLERYRMPS